jgi:hypothetical protein
VPTWILPQLYEKLVEIAESRRAEEDLEKNAKKFIQQMNEEIRRQGLNFITIYSPRRATLLTTKFKYFIIVKIDFKKLVRFLEKFAKEEEPLLTKYRYLAESRIDVVPLIRRRGLLEETLWKNTQAEVKRNVKPDIKTICRTIERTMKKLDKLQRKAELKYRRRMIKPLFWFAQTETITTLKSCVELIKNGLIASTYREFRKIIELLGCAIFTDLLLKNMLKVWKQPNIWTIPWMEVQFFKIMDTREKRVTNLSDLNGVIKEIYDKVSVYFEMKGKPVSFITFQKVCARKMSFPLFVALCGIDHRGKYAIERGLIEEPATKNLARIVATVLHKRKETKSDLRVAEVALRDMKTKQYLTPKCPTASFMIQFADFLTHQGWERLYSDYSSFVHTYFETFQISPFSSILEFKILREESKRFMNSIEGITSWYSKIVYSP